MIAVVAGPTGLVGNFLISKLLKDDSITQIIALSRRSLHFTSQKLKVVLVHELSEMSNVEEMLKGDLYFCCLGSTIKKAKSKENFIKIDLDAVRSFGEIAKKFNARSFVTVSAAGANKSSYVFYNIVKGRAEEELEQLKLHRLVIFRPGLLIGEREEKRTLEKLAINFFNFISPILGNEYSRKIGTKVDELADRMIEEAKKDLSGKLIIGPTEI
jgi:uncharacterized protein YbjT (DUF2867 family)